jgi:hypothetical protein
MASVSKISLGNNGIVIITGINGTKGVVEDTTRAGDDIVPITRFDSTLG